MRRSLADSIGSIAGILFVAAQLFLLFGGLSYRKDCVNDQGQVRKDWTFTWFAPVPYVFRPSEPGCTVHTGTRVAMNAAGIFGYEETTASSVAQEWADQTDSPESAYWVQLRGALQDYAARNESVTEIDDALSSVDTALELITALVPPPRFKSAHDELVTALQRVRDSGEALRTAATSQDEVDFERATQRVEPDARRVQEAIAELNRTHAG